MGTTNTHRSDKPPEPLIEAQPVAAPERTTYPPATPIRVVSGFGWQLGNTLARQGIGFATTVFLARLLSPAEFGLVGIALMFAVWVGIAGDAGVGATLIHESQITDDIKRTGFWMAAAMGGLAGLGLALLAVPIARFYDQPALLPLVLVNAINLAIGGLGAVPGALLRRSLDFRSVAMVETAGTLTSGACAITLAARHTGALSIPLGSLVGLLISLAIYRGLRLLPVWPCPQWRQIGALSRFSLLVSGGRIAEVFRITIDNALVSKLLGPLTLGYYAFSYNLIAIPEYRVVGLITQVAFPALARIQADRERVRAAYLRILRYVLLIVLPSLLGLQLVADRLIPLIYGTPWLPAVPVLQILCVAGIGSALAVLTDAPLLALGHAAWIFRLNVAWVGLLGIGLVIGLSLEGGLTVVAGTVSAVAMLLCLWRNGVTLRLCQVSGRQFVQAAYPAFMATGAMLTVVAGFKSLVNWANAGWTEVLAVVVLGVSVYGGVALSLLPELWAAGRRWLQVRREAPHAVH